MTIRIVSFFALVFTALAMVSYGAHLFALPNKIGMTEAQYFIAQSVYQGWSLLAVVLIPAMLLNIAVAALLWGKRARFAWAVAACICMIATLAVSLPNYRSVPRRKSNCPLVIILSGVGSSRTWSAPCQHLR